MNNTVKPSDAIAYIQRQAAGFTPKIGVILGSGLNHLGEQFIDPIRIPYCDIPGFTHCQVAGHKGEMLLGLLNGLPVACLQGRAHYYEGKSHTAFQIPIRALKGLGCEMLILTNAAASLRETVQPGNLVVISDHINFQFQNPLIGENDDEFETRFPSLQSAYDPELISHTLKLGKALNLNLTTGVYLATSGPSYETPAEIRAFRILGADLVGMSTVPEVIVARHCGLKVLAISTVTNLACGMSHEALTHESVLEVAKMAANDLTQLLLKVIQYP